jgi:hypothetical protein
MGHAQDVPAIPSNLSLADLIEDFCSACELVKDLPSSNGEDEWNNFEDLWQQVQARPFGDVRNMIFEHASIELINSPLFEILFEIEHEVAPPKTFASARLGPLSEHSTIMMRFVRIQPSFTARDFLSLCVILDTDFLKHMKFGHHPLTSKFMGMLSLLHNKEVNVLDFLSTEDTDAMLETCPLFRVLMHTLSASACHVLVKLNEVEQALLRLKAPQGFHSQGDSIDVPPYPPDERYGLKYDYAQFLQYLQNAEDHISQFQFDGAQDYGHSSFDILHRRLHEMVGRVTVAEFMAGREPTEGTPGAIIYNHLIDACNPQLECILFFANIASDGDGEAFLENAWQPLAQNPGVISRLEATTLVDKLKKVDLADIARENMKCMHCWCQFDEVEEGVDNLPVQLPCDSRHMLGRDCLIDILVKTGPLCPLCRVDIVALSAR